jgi:hypothetical protein
LVPKHFQLALGGSTLLKSSAHAAGGLHGGGNIAAAMR